MKRTKMKHLTQAERKLILYQLAESTERACAAIDDAVAYVYASELRIVALTQTESLSGITTDQKRMHRSVVLDAAD